MTVVHSATPSYHANAPGATNCCHVDTPPASGVPAENGGNPEWTVLVNSGASQEDSAANGDQKKNEINAYPHPHQFTRLLVQSTNTDLRRTAARVHLLSKEPYGASNELYISVYLLYWKKCANTDVRSRSKRALRGIKRALYICLLALLEKICKH